MQARRVTCCYARCSTAYVLLSTQAKLFTPDVGQPERQAIVSSEQWLKGERRKP